MNTEDTNGALPTLHASASDSIPNRGVTGRAQMTTLVAVFLRLGVRWIGNGNFSSRTERQAAARMNLRSSLNL
jgi:hypothetical protein